MITVSSYCVWSMAEAPARNPWLDRSCAQERPDRLSICLRTAGMRLELGHRSNRKPCGFGSRGNVGHDFGQGRGRKSRGYCGDSCEPARAVIEDRDAMATQIGVRTDHGVTVLELHDILRETDEVEVLADPLDLVKGNQLLTVEKQEVNVDLRPRRVDERAGDHTVRSNVGGIRHIRVPEPCSDDRNAVAA